MSEKNNRFDLGSAFGEVNTITKEALDLIEIMMAKAAVASTVASDRVKRTAEVTKNVAKNAPGIAINIGTNILNALQADDPQLGDRPPKN